MNRYLKKGYPNSLGSLKRNFLVLLILWIPAFMVAQGDKKEDLPGLPLARVLQKLTVSGTIRMRYTSSLQDNVDVNGVHYAPDSKQDFSTNAFTIPQVRIVVTGDVTENLNVYFRANFGDFSGNPQNKVLEYAFATYRINNFVNLRAGLFRPEFGREDDIATEFLQSFDYTNQYNAFAENGWMNYQIGVSLLGELSLMGKPIKYAVGVFNGNGRNGFTDNDNGKQFPARISLGVTPDLEIGLNGGAGTSREVSVTAWGADVNYQKQLSAHFKLAVLSEYKQGNNQSLFFSQTAPQYAAGDYKMRGIYVLPSLNYEIFSKHVKGLEASFKYEYLDPNYKLNGNVRQQYVPMLGIDFAEKYALRLQTGMLIDNYKNNVENSTQHNSSRFITQLQIRF